MKTQKDNILEYLQKGWSLSGLDGLKLFGTLALRNRISELRKEGYIILDKTVRTAQGKHYKVYFMDSLFPK